MVMEFAKQYLSREEWISTYEAQKSRNNAGCALLAFDKYVNEKFEGDHGRLYQSLREDEDWRYRFLSNMVQYWKTWLGAASISNYFMFVKSWLWSQGIKTNPEEIKQTVKMPKRIIQIRQGLTYETIRLLISHCSETYRALYLVLASSGMRIGEAVSLVREDVDFSVSPVRVHLRAENTKTKEERWTFISGEAAKALKPIWEQAKSGGKIFPMSADAAEMQMSKLRDRAGLKEKYSSSFYKTNIHAFRAFFRTKVGSVNKDLSEKLLGHRGYLSQYVRYSPEELAAEYAKVEHLVVISAEHRLEEENDKLRRNAESIDDMKRKLMEYEDRIKILEKVSPKDRSR